MRAEQATISKSVARGLMELGAERGGQVICAVVMRLDEIEFIWPAELNEHQIEDCECAIVEALMDRWSDPG